MQFSVIISLTFFYDRLLKVFCGGGGRSLESVLRCLGFDSGAFEGFCGVGGRSGCEMLFKSENWEVVFGWGRLNLPQVSKTNKKPVYSIHQIPPYLE